MSIGRKNKTALFILLFFAYVHSKAQEKNDTLPSVCFMPEPVQFPGGYDSLKVYIKNNLKWPAPDWCGEGTVFVKFKVDCNGNISNTTVLRGIDSLANQEALRVINHMPKWVNGDCKRFPEGMWYNLPIKFK